MPTDDPRDLKAQLDVSVDDVDAIRYEIEDYVATITIDRPEKNNALTMDMFDAIYDAIKKADKDEDVKTVLIRGEGDNFCAGHDLSEVYHVYEEYDGEEAGERSPSQRARLHFDTQLLEHYRGMAYSLKPIVCAIDGWCVGAGIYMNMVADLSIASESAKLSHRELRLGRHGASFMTEIEYLELSPSKARELMLTGRTVTGQELEDIGLVNAVVPDDEFDDEVERWTEAISLLSRDGLVMGGVRTNTAYETLGVGHGFQNGVVGHTLGTNIRFESDEYNFVGTRGEEDTSAAIGELHERFSDLGFN